MSAEPDWSLYRTFLAVVREGSLSAAARRLGLTQPTVARHVEALEASLGAELFLRSQAGLSPTPVAQAMTPYAEELAATTAAMARTASRRRDEVAGTVRVSVGEVIALERLPEILTGLRQEHPKLVVELVVSDSLHDLLRRDADIAVRQAEPKQEALLARKLPPNRLGLFAHEDYLARRGTPGKMADLTEHDLIGWDRETAVTRAFHTRFPGIGRSDLALRADSNAAQLALIRAGFGIGMTHVAVAEREPQLRRVLADAISPELPLWMVMHEDLKTTPACRVVFDALWEGLRG